MKREFRASSPDIIKLQEEGLANFSPKTIALEMQRYPHGPKHFLELGSESIHA